MQDWDDFIEDEEWADFFPDEFPEPTTYRSNPLHRIEVAIGRKFSPSERDLYKDGFTVAELSSVSGLSQSAIRSRQRRRGITKQRGISYSVSQAESILNASGLPDENEEAKNAINGFREVSLHYNVIAHALGYTKLSAIINDCSGVMTRSMECHVGFYTLLNTDMVNVAIDVYKMLLVMSEELQPPDFVHLIEALQPYAKRE